jgi:hypothetical protein
MTDYTVLEEQENKNKKPTTFLIILAVLSLLNMAFSFFGTIASFFSGPFSEDEMEAQNADIYESISLLQDQGMNGFAKTLEKIMLYADYINSEAFVISNVTSLLVSIIGIIAVVLMLKLKKIGFHLYVAYSLLPILLMYVIAPAEFITTIVVVTSLIVSGIFCLLYGLNLKHMK